MRFLIDECFNQRVATLLNEAGHEAVHVTAIGLAGHPDEEVMAVARIEARVLVSADTDFGELLVNSRDTMPSVNFAPPKPRGGEPSSRDPGGATRHRGATSSRSLRRDKC